MNILEICSDARLNVFNDAVQVTVKSLKSGRAVPKIVCVRPRQTKSARISSETTMTIIKNLT